MSTSQELPFRAGGRVLHPYFIDRKDEVEELSILMAGLGQHTLVVGQRRVGKSSFLLNASLQAKRRNPKLAVVDIDCLTVGSMRDLAERILDGMLSQYRDQHAAKGWLLVKAAALEGAVREAVSRIERIGVNSLEKVLTMFVDFREGTIDGRRLLLEALEFAEQFATEQKMQAILVLDELQELGKIEDAVFALLKSQGDRAKNVRYVFSGSAPGLLDRIFFRKDGVLYQMAGRIYLGPLPDADVRSFVRSRLATVGLEVNEAALERWLNVSGAIPYYVQKLGLAVYLLALHAGKAAVDEALVGAAYHHLLDELGGDFAGRFGSKFNGTQRRILMALARGGPLKRSDLARKLGRKSEWLSKDLDKLADWMEVVKDARGVYRIADPIFASWLAGSRFALQPMRPKRRPRKRKL